MKPPRFFVIQGGPSPQVILNRVERRHGKPVRAVMGEGDAPGFVYSIVEIARSTGAQPLDNAVVRVIRCTCKPGQWPCECKAVRRETIVRVEDAEAMVGIEEARLR